MRGQENPAVPFAGARGLAREPDFGHAPRRNDFLRNFNPRETRPCAISRGKPALAAKYLGLAEELKRKDTLEYRLLQAESRRLAASGANG